MSGLQTIIDSCVNLEFDRRRIVASSVSRSQRIRTAERMAAQPPSPPLDYSNTFSVGMEYILSVVANSSSSSS